MYLPLHGFADSLNLSVAAALVLHRLLAMAPGVVGNMAVAERAVLRKAFYAGMARKPEQKELFTSLADRVSGGEIVVEPFGDLRRPDHHRKHQFAHILPATSS